MKNKRHFVSVISVAIFFLLFAMGLGRAARVINAPAIVEAEDIGDVEHGGGLGNITGWWAFWSNGSLKIRYNASEEGSYKIAVKAAGTAALDPDTNEKWPKMSVVIDNGASKFEYDIKEAMASPKVYYTDAFTLGKGEHAVSIAFTNDYGRAGEDRNLFIDWTGIGPVQNAGDMPALTLGEKLLQADKNIVEPDWVFESQKNASGWRVWKECRIEAGKNYLKITSTDREPLALAPRIEIKSDDLNWVSFQLKADKGTKGEIIWFKKGQPAAQRQEFALIADNQSHFYAVDMFMNPDWEGRIAGIALRPSDAKGAKCELRSFRVAGSPKGPAEIRIREFGMDDVINVTGENAKLLCVLENVGGEPAKDISITLQLPDALQAIGGEKIQVLNVLEKKKTIQWLVFSMSQVQDAAKITVSGANFTPVSAQSIISITQKVQVAPVIIGGKVYPPDPVPARTKYLVGAYYFPGWKQGAVTGWDAIKPFPERKPVLGWYQEGEPDAASWQIKWAVEHGISFFAYDWYWDRGSRALEHALLDGYMNSPFKKYLKFCLLWANHNPKGSSSEKDLLDVTRYWIDTYFKQSGYLKIDGKPVVIIFSVGRFTEDMGVAYTKVAFEKMKGLCRDSGLNGLYIIGCSYPVMDTIRQMEAEGYDAVTGYNYPAAGSTAVDGNRPPYDSAVNGYNSIWEEIAGYKLLDYIAVTDPGWDNRPWAGDKSMVRTGKNPDKFRRMLELARGFADRHPIGEEKNKIVLVEAWNEFGEGDYIEPHREFGFGYLDAIRSVFAEEDKDHRDVTPKDMKFEVKQWSDVQPRTYWEFDERGNAEGWGAMMGLSKFEISGGVMKAEVSTGDPAFAASVSIDPSKYKFAVIKMKISKGNSAQLFWTTSRSPESERNSLSFKTSPDTLPHEYLLKLGEVKSWRGDITRLRLDPGSNAPGAAVEIDYIRFSEQAPVSLKQ